MKLIEATLEQKVDRDRCTYGAWGEKLSLERYLAREMALRRCAFGSKQATWLWVSDEGEVLSSCETFTVAAWMGGRPEVGVGLASVYTEPALRGRGHAAQMLRAVLDRLLDRHAGAKVFMGFSEAGAEFYLRLGFGVRDAFERVIDLDASAPGSGVPSPDRWVERSELSQECPWLVPPPEVRQGRLDSIWPAREQIEWHWVREKFYASELGFEAPTQGGAVLNSDWILWAGDYKHGVFRVLALSSKSMGSTVGLVQLAMAEAKKAGLSRVSIWQDPLWATSEVLSRIPGKTLILDQAIPILHGLGGSLDPQRWSVLPRGAWL